jgi:sporulation protein YqfC
VIGDRIDGVGGAFVNRDNNKNKAPGWVERLGDLLELPQEIMLNLPQVSLVGNDYFRIENHRGIIEYRPDLIRINTSKGEVAVRGQKLQIRVIITEEIIISGKIIAFELTDWEAF